MIEYLKIISEETHFMVGYSEKINITNDEQVKIIMEKLNSDKDIMIAAFINNELIGNASISCMRNYIKLKHRAAFGIFIKEKYWNNGIGSALLREALNKQVK